MNETVGQSSSGVPGLGVRVYGRVEHGQMELPGAVQRVQGLQVQDWGGRRRVQVAGAVQTLPGVPGVQQGRQSALSVREFVGRPPSGERDPEELPGASVLQRRPVQVGGGEEASAVPVVVGL